MKNLNRVLKRLYSMLFRESNAPGNNTISQKEAEDEIKKHNKDLLNTNKWVRFVLTGMNQGTTSNYGYAKINNVIHYYYVEQHSFQSPGKQTKNTKYKNVFLDCEVDKNSNRISPINFKEGTDDYPFVALNAIKTNYNINDAIKITFCKKDESFIQLQERVESKE